MNTHLLNSSELFFFAESIYIYCSNLPPLFALNCHLFVRHCKVEGGWRRLSTNNTWTHKVWAPVCQTTTESCPREIYEPSLLFRKETCRWLQGPRTESWRVCSAFESLTWTTCYFVNNYIPVTKTQCPSQNVSRDKHTYQCPGK